MNKMTEPITPVEVTIPQVEIEDVAEDTPRTIDIPKSEQNTTRAYQKVLVAVATATQIFGSPQTGFTDIILDAQDMTRLSKEEIPDQEEIFRPQPAASFELFESPAQEANRIRLELLARQYVSKQLSPEEDARLAIVTEKVRRLIPRVTVEDFEALALIAEESKMVRARNEDRRRRLAL
jgi:hypothetical protein